MLEGPPRLVVLWYTVHRMPIVRGIRWGREEVLRFNVGADWSRMIDGKMMNHVLHTAKTAENNTTGILDRHRHPASASVHQSWNLERMTLEICGVWCIYRVSKNCADLFLSELRQISTDFNNFWRVDGKWSEILRGEFFPPHLERVRYRNNNNRVPIYTE